LTAPSIFWCRSGRGVTGADETNLLDQLFARDLLARDLLDRLFARFPRVILEDFEFISAPGERPDVVCGAFLDLRTGQTTLLWRDQLDKLNGRLPYDDGPKTLVVSLFSMPRAPAIYRSVSHYLRMF